MAAKTKVLKAPYHPDGSLLHYPGDFHQFSHYEDTATGERLERNQIWEKIDIPEREPRQFFTQMERQVRPYNSWKSVYLEPEWRDNAPFEATLQIESVRSGRSAKYLMLRPFQAPLDVRRFPMFVADLIEVAVAQGISVGGAMPGRWMVSKRGQNYGLRMAKDHE